MKVEVVMPKMGESIQEGKILRWLKKEGDRVERDEIILEISTDKVDTEVPSPIAGIITRLLAAENDTVEVGKTIAELETDDSSAGSSPATVAVAEQTVTPVAVTASTSSSELATTSANEPVSGSGYFDVVMPKMGESIQEGKILRWLKKEGDSVERDEILLEISTDKVDTEVPSPSAGTLVKILAQENDVVEVGAAIARLSSGAGATQLTSEKPAPPPASVQPVAETVVNKSISSAITSQTVMQVPFPTGGGTKKIPRSHSGKFFSPLVRSIAESHGISLEELLGVNGSGLEGRITKNDINHYLENRQTIVRQTIQAVPSGATVSASPAPSQIASPSVVNAGDKEIIPMDRMRQLIAEHMVRSKQISPHVTSVAEVDVTNLVKLREKKKDAFVAREGVKLTLTPFFAKSIVDAIREFPMINVSIEGSNIIRHRHTNLSFATVLPDGNLIVPVIKNAEMMNVAGLAHSISDLANRARTKKLSPDDIQGGTITLTNMGAWGTLFGSPVINQPQTAIIGVYAIQKRPVVREVNGEDVIAIRSMCYVSITYDHRVIDGALASNALMSMVRSLEAMNESTLDV